MTDIQILKRLYNDYTKKYLNKIRSLRDHGMDYSNDIQNSKPSFMKDHQNAGYNFRMTDIQASLGISQMNRSDKILRERQDIAFRYDEAFASNEGIGNPVVKEENFIHGYQSYACIYKPNDVKKALESKDYDSLINISEKEINFEHDFRKSFLKIPSKGIFSWLFQLSTIPITLIFLLKKKLIK